MEALVYYLLKSALILSLFWVVYTIFLKKETFFSLNRWFLILGMVTAMVLPFVQFQQLIFVNVTEALPSATHTAPTQNVVSTPVNPWEILFYMYLIGCIGMTLQLSIELFSLRRIIKNGRLRKQSKGIKYIEVNQTTGPFSFFNCIIYNPNQYNTSELKSILTHEKVHVSQKHSIDILLGALIKVALWFNPISWLYKKELSQNLEYIADFESCSRAEQSEKEYQYLLLNQMCGVQNSVINPFYNSLIKTRIIMLQKSRSPRKSILKILLVLPLLAGFMTLFSFTKKKQYLSAKADQPIHLITKDYSDKELKATQAVIQENGDDFIDFKAPTTQDTIPPLYVIDGKIQSLDFEVNTIDPENIESMNVLKGKSGTDKYGKKGGNGVIEITLKTKKKPANKPLIIIDDKEMSADFDLNTIDKNTIESLHVYKDKMAVEKYGKNAKDGVIFIKTKSNTN